MLVTGAFLVEGGDLWSRFLRVEADIQEVLGEGGVDEWRKLWGEIAKGHFIRDTVSRCTSYISPNEVLTLVL